MTCELCLIRCYSPNLWGSSTLGYLSFSPFLRGAKWAGVRDRIAGLNGTNFAESSFLLKVRTVPYFSSINES